MTRRRLKIPELPHESIGAFRTLDDAVFAQKQTIGDRPIACRQDIAPPCGWSRVKYYAGKVFMRSGASI
ncbi:MAG: hypothetical protein NUV51_05580 [Sulfuricaulis sp.]|nr:hypothetical protein [Sulfuricaulis sp.]